MAAIIHCALNGLTGSGKAYFFRGTHFLLFDWERLTTDHTGATFKGRAVGGPFPITDEWFPTIGIVLSGFASSFDAALSGDAGGDPRFRNKMYVFQGVEYARYDYTHAPVRLPDSSGAVSAWNLGPQFQSGIRGVLNGKLSRAGKAYFFKGPQYVRYSWANDGADPNYPKAIATLADMPSSFASDIQATLDGDKDFTNFAYLFKDDQYIRYNWQSLRVDNGPHPIQENWPAVIELLFAGEAKVQAIAWVTQAANELQFYIGETESGIPSPFDTVKMEAALQTHFHIPTSMASTVRIGHMRTIKSQLDSSAAKLTTLHTILHFHDDGEVKAHDATYVEADGRPKFRAYTGHNDRMFITSKFPRGTGPLFRAAILVHESIHFVDAAADCMHDSPEWYTSGKPRLTCDVGGTPQEVEYYDRLTVGAALHNPSSYAAFSQHIFYGQDKRFGEGNPSF